VHDKSRAIPKLRLDALTDGVFAVAMTLLVIDLKLPESFHPKDAAELLHRLGELWNQIVVYVVSFYVLGLRWTGMVQMAPPGENVSPQYTKWALLHLLLITLVPFTTMVMGRHINYAPATWLYAANTIAFALVAIRMISLTEPEHARAHLDDRLGLIVLIGASLLTIAASFFTPQYAMLFYLTNLLDGPLRWILRRRGVIT
jgi:uncharacterized membrane protein